MNNPRISTELLADLDSLHSLIKQSEQQTDDLDRIFSLAKAHLLISNLKLNNPFIELIQQKIDHKYRELRGPSQPLLGPSHQTRSAAAFEPIAASPQIGSYLLDSPEGEDYVQMDQTESKEVSDLLRIDQAEFNREQLRNDIIRIVQAEQQPISLKKINKLLEPKYGDSDGLKFLISQLTSQLGSWSWHASNWWKPDYMTKGIYKSSNYCVAINAPDIDTDLYYVNWSIQGYVAKVRSYLSNFRKTPEVINGIYAVDILRLAEVKADLKEFTTQFNSLGSVFIIVDSAFYHRDNIANLEVEYCEGRYCVKDYDLDTHELSDTSSLVTFLYELFGMLAQREEYQAATLTTNITPLPKDIQVLVDDGISLKPRRNITKLPQPL